ncbi:MAG: hypothetical protein WB765_20070 [Acidimicrobiales bacterium]|jgi:uncharacterized protein (TIGR03086 family)
MTTTAPATIRVDNRDPRLGLATAVGLARAVIARVDENQLHGPTLCTDVSVRDLLGQMVDTLTLVAGAARGEDAPTEPARDEDAPTQPARRNVRVAASGVAETGWVEAWEKAAHELQAAWSAPGVLERTMGLPFGELPGAAVLTVYTGRITIQAWELAIATQRPGWDVGTVAAALAASGWAGPPTR